MFGPQTPARRSRTRDGGATALEREADGYFAGLVANAGPGTRYRFRLDGDADLYPDPASRFQPEGPHGPSEVVDPAAFRWTDADWPGVTLAGQVHLRDARRHVHAGRHLGRGRASSCPELAAAGHHRAGGDAGRRVPRPVRLGLRRRQPVRPDAGSTAGPTTCAASSTAPTPSASASSSTWSTTTSARTATTSASSPTDYFTDRYKNEWGEAINFDGPNAGPVREFFIANAALLDRRVPPRRPAPRRDAGHLRRLARPHPGRSRQPGRAGGRASARFILSPRTSRRTRSWCGRASRAATASTRCGTTTSTTRAMVALTGHNEAYYTDYRGTPQEFISAAEVGLSLPGPVLLLAEEAARHAGARTCRRPHFVTFLAEPRPGRQLRPRPAALTSADQSGPVSRHDRADAARRPARRCCSRDRSSPRPARSSTSPTTTRSWPSWSRRPARVPGAVPQPGHAGDAGVDPATRPTRRRFERCKLDFCRAPNATPTSTLCTATCCGCAATTRRSGPAHRGVDGAVLGPEAFVLRFFADDGDDRLLSSTSAATCTCAQRPSRCWPRPQGHAGRCSGRAKTCATAAAGRRRWSTAENWRHSRARRPWCWCRSPMERRRSSRRGGDDHVRLGAAHALGGRNRRPKTEPLLHRANGS